MLWILRATVGFYGMVMNFFFPFFDPKPVSQPASDLKNAENYEDWQQAAVALDDRRGLKQWRELPGSKLYDHDLITLRLRSLRKAREDKDLPQLLDLVRAGLVRGLGNITQPRLYSRSFAGTKHLIEDYINEVANAIDLLEQDTLNDSTPGTSSASHKSYLAAVSTQRKLDFVHQASQALGRTSLVLQGGALFGLCHVGVVRALFQQNLLPRIITGTATGALIAALVAVHSDEELPSVLNGERIDLSAFENIASASPPNQTFWQSMRVSWRTIRRRVKRFFNEGYFLDVKVLEQCVMDNVGDLTFEEAHNKSKRVLNITVAVKGNRGIPSLLNYVTAPNVLIRTAAIASNAGSPSIYGSKATTVLCKDLKGNIVEWAPAAEFHHYAATSVKGARSPLGRVSELFNVNHFIISQARPYLIPFQDVNVQGPSTLNTNPLSELFLSLIRLFGRELRHWLHLMDIMGALPASTRRLLIDEEVPSASMTLVPTVAQSDFARLLEMPSRDALEYWVLRGERSVWPAVTSIKIRCLVEFKLDEAFQRVRHLKAPDLRRKASTAAAFNLHELGAGDQNTGSVNNQYLKPPSPSES